MLGFDDQVLIGKSETEAQQYTEDRGLTMRVTKRDGKAYATTMEFKAERVNVAVDKDVVTEILGRG